MVVDFDVYVWSSQALDYEKYNTNWADMAVSMPSDYTYRSMYNTNPANPSAAKTLLQVVVPGGES